MPTINVRPDSATELQAIADVMGKSKKVVVITGAGISTNCGIPDFRSENGLYSLIQAQYDAAAKDPSAYTEEIDYRPTKRRRVTDRWTYVTVARETGEIVNDPDLVLPTPNSQLSRSNSTEQSGPSSSISSDIDASDNPSFDAKRLRRSLRSKPLTANEADCTTSSAAADLAVTELAGANEIASTNEPAGANELAGAPAGLLRNLSEKFASEKLLSKPPSLLTINREPTSTLPASPSKRSPSRLSSPEPNRSSNSTDPSVSRTQPPPKPFLRRQSSSVLTTTEGSSSQSFSSSQSSRASLPNLKGKDLFDSMIWSDAFTTSVFYRFISTLRHKVQNDVQTTTESHRFIKTLRDGGRLVRCYTQNIDGLEEREGLSTELELGPGDRSRFSTKAQKEAAQIVSEGLDGGRRRVRGGVEVVQLHGSLVGLRCGICGSISSWDDEDRHETTSAGQAPECPTCESKNASRTGRGRRSLTVGRLRPDIVLYGEEHPSAHLISPLITHDLSLSPDVLLILGTSLRVHGLKVMVREFAKSVHNKGGKVVFVNNTKPSESVWGDVIDYWVEWDCDAWVADLRERREDIWSPLGAIKEKKSKRPSLTNAKSDSKKPSRPSATRDCRSNGVHFTFKILESLAKILDTRGDSSAQHQLDPVKPMAAKVAMTTVKVVSTTTQSTKSKTRKSTAPGIKNSSRVKKPVATKTSSSTALPNFSMGKVALISRNLSPEATRQALAALSANANRPLPKTYGEFFRYSLSSDVLPGLSWPSPSMNLVTHPPNTTGLPQHRPFKDVESRSENELEKVGKQPKDAAQLDIQRIKSLKELGLRYTETGNGIRRTRGGLRSRRPSMELPPVSIQVEAQPTPPSSESSKDVSTTEDSVTVRLPKACAECKRRKVRCNPAHQQTETESSLPILKNIITDSNDTAQMSELRSSSSTSSDLQESVDAQLLSEASALMALSTASSTTCGDCKTRRRRCPSCQHRPSLPTPSTSYSSTEVISSHTRAKLPTPPISSDPVTAATLTPTARRIKDMGHIGAVLSSPLKPTTRSSGRSARRGSCS